MELFKIAVRVAELGLIVYENYDNQEIDIAGPASVLEAGMKFKYQLWVLLY